jgi:ubiquinone/menaquinone biosynthesis C-methylase UbiE
VSFIPRTIRQLITSSAEADGKLTVAARRQLKQQQDRRENSAKITYSDQRADDLRETESESVDVVISLQAVARMMENGQDWKRSVREAARVLKPGGRLLFVEQTDLNGESYVDYVENLLTLGGEVIKEQEQAASDGDEDDEEDEETRFPIFDDIGYDDVDLVLTPHIAGGKF